jgi:hypothetical protein
VGSWCCFPTGRVAEQPAAPTQAPGSAHDPSVAGLSFEYDYINPHWPGVSKILQVRRQALWLP